MGLLRVNQAVQKPNSQIGGTKLLGYVIDDADPDKRQRVRIRIPQLHKGVPDNELPWAVYRAEGQHNSGAGAGSVRVPTKGSKVYSSFDDNDPHHPYYGGSPTTDDVNKDNELLQEDYPNTYGQIDQAGNMWKVNTQQNTMQLKHVSGMAFDIGSGGDVTIASPGNVTISAKGNLTIVADGALKMHAQGETSIKGSAIKENCSDGAASSVSISARSKPQIDQKQNQIDM